MTHLATRKELLLLLPVPVAEKGLKAMRWQSAEEIALGASTVWMALRGGRGAADAADDDGPPGRYSKRVLRAAGQECVDEECVDEKGSPCIAVCWVGR